MFAVFAAGEFLGGPLGEGGDDGGGEGAEEEGGEGGGGGERDEELGGYREVGEEGEDVERAYCGD